jgi:hypothetical protein
VLLQTARALRGQKKGKPHFAGGRGPGGVLAAERSGAGGGAGGPRTRRHKSRTRRHKSRTSGAERRNKHRETSNSDSKRPAAARGEISVSHCVAPLRAPEDGRGMQSAGRSDPKKREKKKKKKNRWVLDMLPQENDLRTARGARILHAVCLWAGGNGEPNACDPRCVGWWLIEAALSLPAGLVCPLRLPPPRCLTRHLPRAQTRGWSHAGGRYAKPGPRGERSVSDGSQTAAAMVEFTNTPRGV